MASVQDVLREHEVTIAESLLAAELRVLLETRHAANTHTLTSDEERFLAEHGGVPAASKRKMERLDARSAAHAVLEAAESLSRRQVAQLLGVDESRVSHRVREGSLYSYPGASERRR